MTTEWTKSGGTNNGWAGPVDKAYEDSSNVVHAHRMRGHLLLTWGELDSQCGPSSSMQVVNALIRADKDFTCSSSPGWARHWRTLTL
ncbi:MAG: prolyl oligopeptidase family serine peptidase [Verrucomicrobiales bacterium]